MSRPRTPWRPPCRTTPAPGLIAREDQDAAQLADLVRTAARHHARCARPQQCAGEAVEGLLEKLEEEAPGTPFRVLLLAIAELAERPRDDGAYDLTDAGRAAVDDPRPGHPRGRRVA